MPSNAADLSSFVSLAPVIKSRPVNASTALFALPTTGIISRPTETTGATTLATLPALLTIFPILPKSPFSFFLGVGAGFGGSTTLNCYESVTVVFVISCRCVYLFLAFLLSVIHEAFALSSKG